MQDSPKTELQRLGRTVLLGTEAQGLESVGKNKRRVSRENYSTETGLSGFIQTTGVMGRESSAQPWKKHNMEDI